MYDIVRLSFPFACHLLTVTVGKLGPTRNKRIYVRSRLPHPSSDPLANGWDNRPNVKCFETQLDQTLFSLNVRSPDTKNLSEAEDLASYKSEVGSPSPSSPLPYRSLSRLPYAFAIANAN